MGIEHETDDPVIIAECALGMDLADAGAEGFGGMCECGRPRAKHVIIREEQLETVWEQGIVATICARVGNGEVAVWVTREVEELDPCDEDFMKEISS